MIKSFNKSPVKLSLLGLTMVLILSGCALTNAESNEKTEQKPVQSHSTENKNQNENQSIQLTFKPVTMMDVTQGEPKKIWEKVKSISLGEQDAAQVSIHLYVEPGNENSAYAFLEHKGELFEFGDVADTFGLDDVVVESVNQSFLSDKKNIKVFAGIGTTFTGWDIISYDEEHSKWLRFEAIGRPQMIDLDGDGIKEMIATFEGAHLNAPDISIVRWNNGHLEFSEIAAQSGISDKSYARLIIKDNLPVVEIGELGIEKSEYYKYTKGLLVKITD